MKLFLITLEDVHEDDDETVRVVSPLVVPADNLEQAEAVAKEIAAALGFPDNDAIGFVVEITSYQQGDGR